MLSIMCVSLSICVFVCERSHKHFRGGWDMTASGIIPHELSGILFCLFFETG